MRSPIIGGLEALGRTLQPVGKAALGIAKQHPLLRPRPVPAPNDRLHNDPRRFAPRVIRPAAPKPNQVAQQQAFLKARGYNIVVDGKLGPKTQSALADWHSGKGSRNPGRWSQKNAPLDDGRRSTPVTRNNQPVTSRAGGGYKAPPAPPRAQPKGGTQKPVQTGARRPAMPAGPMSNYGPASDPVDGTFDVDVLARAQMEAKYGPVLAELLRQEQRIRSAGENRVAEIGDMYRGYVGDIRGRNTEAAKVRGDMTQAIAGLAPAVAGGIAMDEGAASEVAARGAIEGSYANMAGQAASDFDRRMGDAAQMGGAFAGQQANQAYQGQLEEVGAQRKDVMAQQGADLVASRQALQEWQVEQTMRQREAALQERLGQASVQDASIKNSIALMEMQAAQAMLPLEGAKTQAQLDALYADIRNTNARTASIMNPQPQGLTPAQQLAEERAMRGERAKNNEATTQKNMQTLNAMYAQTRHENGQWRVGLTQTWTRAKAALRASGIDPNSARGKQLLKQYAQLNGIKLGPKGNPTGRTTAPKKK